MIYYSESERGSQALAVLGTAIQEAGLSVYGGNPLENGCPFDFSGFTYQSTSSNLFRTIMGNPNDMCMVLAIGDLTATSFVGHSQTNGITVAVFYRDSEGELQAYLWSILLLKMNYAISNSGVVAARGTTGDTTLVVGKNIFGCCDPGGTSGFYTKGMQPCMPETIESKGALQIAISKAPQNLGLSFIAFPSGDTHQNILDFTALINGVKYDIIGKSPTKNITLAIY